MLDATRDDEDLSLPEVDRRLSLKLDAEGSFPAQKDLVFEMRVPLERPVQLRDADGDVVRASEVRLLPRLGDAGRCETDVDLAPGYFAYSTARVSRMTVILI